MRRIAPSGVDVDWAPDGKRLVYATRFGRRYGTDFQASGGDLYVVGRDGRRRRRLVARENLAEVSPVWSRDGRWVTWASLGFEGRGDVSFDTKSTLWRVRAGGGQPLRVRPLPAPSVDEGDVDVPELAWLPRR